MLGRRAWTGDGIARWLLPASVLHAAVALVAAALSRWAAPVRVPVPRPSALESEASIELVLLGDETPVAGAVPIEGAPAGALAARVAVHVARAGAARVGGEAAQSSTVVRLEAASGATSSLPG